jgi:biopolymer transport protein ExbB
MSTYYLELIVQGSLYALLLFSVITWVLIIAKGVQHYRLGKRDKQFTKQFWSASTLDAASALATDLEHSWDRQELLERHLRQQIQKEYQSLESGLAVLASIGSTAPFVGLFGTVFGIIHALGAIGKSGSASIDVVAGPIGEALIATGVGIAVAVPAVLAFNFYVRRLKVTAAELDNYATDFVNLAQKNGFRVTRPASSRNGGAAQPVRPVAAPQQGAFA